MTDRYVVHTQGNGGEPNYLHPLGELFAAQATQFQRTCTSWVNCQLASVTPGANLLAAICLGKYLGTHYGSMEMVYSPTWMTGFLYDKCGYNYTSPMDPMGPTDFLLSYKNWLILCDVHLPSIDRESRFFSWASTGPEMIFENKKNWPIRSSKNWHTIKREQWRNKSFAQETTEKSQKFRNKKTLGPYMYFV